MELTLTTRWIEHKHSIETKNIEVGTGIEYYGNGVSNPSPDIVKLKSGNLVIEWEDTSNDTPLDCSYRTQQILTKCGFTN